MPIELLAFAWAQTLFGSAVVLKLLVHFHLLFP
jgi:hypothetical protein